MDTFSVWFPCRRVLGLLDFPCQSLFLIIPCYPESNLQRQWALPALQLNQGILVTCGLQGWQPTTWVFSVVSQLSARMKSWWRVSSWSFWQSNIQTVPACGGGTWWIKGLEPSLLCHSSAKCSLHNLIAQPQSISVDYNSVNSSCGNSSVLHWAEHPVSTEAGQEYLIWVL